MRSRQRISGGVLWDAFLILVLCVGAFLAWRTWDRWKGYVPKLSGVSKEKHVDRVNVSLEKKSALAQTRVRQFLAEAGVSEKNILKSYNEARRAGGFSWLESTLELSRPPRFQSGPFLKRLLVFLSKNDLVLMQDDAGPDAWTLALGDRDHVFQRLVIRGAYIKGGNDS